MAEFCKISKNYERDCDSITENSVVSRRAYFIPFREFTLNATKDFQGFITNLGVKKTGFQIEADKDELIKSVWASKDNEAAFNAFSHTVTIPITGLNDDARDFLSVVRKGDKYVIILENTDKGNNAFLVFGTKQGLMNVDNANGEGAAMVSTTMTFITNEASNGENEPWTRIKDDTTDTFDKNQEIVISVITGQSVCSLNDDVTVLVGVAGTIEATLTWTDPAGIASVEITWNTTEGESQPVSVTPTTETKTITGLTAGIPVQFTVVAVYPNGGKSCGSLVNVTPLL